MARTTVPAMAARAATTSGARRMLGTGLGMDRPKVMDALVPSMLSPPVPSVLAREGVCPPVKDIRRDTKD